MKLLKTETSIKIESDGDTYTFNFLSKIKPRKYENGNLVKTEFKTNTPKNPNGEGPFCSFNIDCKGISESVYIWILNNEIQYIGESKNLNRQFNYGFGNIKEINTTQKGRSTNCKLNHAVLIEYEKGNLFKIFVLETKQHKEIKKLLLANFNPKPKYNERY